MTVETQVIGLQAAADFIGTGALEVPVFEKEIMDRVRRGSVALNRIEQVRATGHPHRYFEQTAIATGAAVDPRSLSSTPTGPTRVERTAFIKAVIAQSNLSLFDKDVTEQQGQFASVVAKDIDDIISGVEIKRASMLWVGTDTSLTAPTTLEWMGGLSQITQQATIAPGASIIDGIKAQVAAMVANSTFVVRPSAIYMNPVLIDHLEQEAKASKIVLNDMVVAVGITVPSINTQAGKLPLIPDPFIPADAGAAHGFGAPPAGNKNYYAVIVSESDVEIAYVSGQEDNPNPRLFQLGLTGNLAGQYVGVKFDTLAFKGASYAHATVAVQRP